MALIKRSATLAAVEAELETVRHVIQEEVAMCEKDPVGYLQIKARCQALEQERRYMLGPFSAEFAIAFAKRTGFFCACSSMLTGVTWVIAFYCTKSSFIAAIFAFFAITLSSLCKLYWTWFLLRYLAVRYNRGLLRQFVVWMLLFIVFQQIWNQIEAVQEFIFFQQVKDHFSTMSPQESGEFFCQELPSVCREIAPHLPEIRLQASRTGYDLTSNGFFETVERVASASHQH